MGGIWDDWLQGVDIPAGWLGTPSDPLAGWNAVGPSTGSSGYSDDDVPSTYTPRNNNQTAAANNTPRPPVEKGILTEFSEWAGKPENQTLLLLGGAAIVLLLTRKKK